MKSETKDKSVFWMTVCALFFFCFMPIRAYAAEQQLSYIEKLYVTVSYGSGDTQTEQKVNWQYADKDGYYLCMPAGADLSNVKLHFTEGNSGEGVDFSGRCG